MFMEKVSVSNYTHVQNVRGKVLVEWILFFRKLSKNVLNTHFFTKYGSQ